jgi:thiol-disulfide isomerase/thioredoxin
MALKNAAALLLPGLLVVAVYAGLHRPADGVEGGDGAGTGSSLAVPAPEVGFPTLAGGEDSLARYRGQVVLLNIWGTWCPPCVREIPHLVEVQGEIEPHGGTVIGLAVDSGTSGDIHDFWQNRIELEPAYPIWMGTNREARRHFDAFGLPNTLIIDRDGIIRERFLGLVTREMLMEELEPYL